MCPRQDSNLHLRHLGLDPVDCETFKRFPSRAVKTCEHAIDRSGSVPLRSKAFRSDVYPSPRPWLEGNPDSVVPESPTIIPLDLSPGRPRRRRWRRRRPRRRWTIAGRAVVVVVPVTAVIPVRVRAPALVPLVARAPVMVIDGCRRRRRLGDARDQPECGQGHATSCQRASAQAKPPFCSHVCIHGL
jgi:hypothetical protein